jgi:hypothetical protein
MSEVRVTHTDVTMRRPDGTKRVIRIPDDFSTHRLPPQAVTAAIDTLSFVALGMLGVLLSPSNTTEDEDAAYRRIDQMLRTLTALRNELELGGKHRSLIGIPHTLTVERTAEDAVLPHNLQEVPLEDTNLSI